jgi:hypothetical protein
LKFFAHLACGIGGKSMPSFFRCHTEFCRIVQDVLVGLILLAAIGAAISLGSSGLQLFSAL